MLYREPGELTKDYLAKMLHACGLHQMADKAKAGNYDWWFAEGEFRDGKGRERLIQELDGEARKTNVTSLRNDIGFVLDMARSGAFDATDVDENVFTNPPGKKADKEPRVDWRLKVTTLKELFPNKQIRASLKAWLADFPNDKEFDDAMQCFSSDTNSIELRAALIAAMKRRFDD